MAYRYIRVGCAANVEAEGKNNADEAIWDSVGYVMSRWREDGLLVKSEPTLIYFVEGEGVLHLGEYELVCPQGSWVLVPPEVPLPDGTRPHLESGTHNDKWCYGKNAGPVRLAARRAKLGRTGLTMNRNLSPQQMFLQLAREHQPSHAFHDGADFEGWKRETLPLVLATLGDYPARVPLNVELLARWEHDGLRKERHVIDVSPYLSATLLINYPADLKEDEQRATICCWHGHGGTGKDPIMGNDNDPLLAGQIRQMNYNYGHQMAKAGFITYAIDWMGQGEHSEENKPNWNMQGGGRDWCNLYYLLATMLGQTSISNHIVHAQAATDFVCSLPEVDENRLGVMGLSGGGTMTTWNALCDERFKAVEIMCYADLWQNFLFRDLNACGMQVAPGLFKLVDLPDLQGLLAPKPLLMDIGAYDSCFTIDGAMECYQKVEKIYSAAGARDRLELDLFPGEHAWGGRKSKEFFTQYLS